MTADSREHIIVFPSFIQHSHMAKKLRDVCYERLLPIAGGFVVNGQCVGRSESLRLDSRGTKDTELIMKALDLDSRVYDNPPEIINRTPKLTKNQAKRRRKIKR